MSELRRDPITGRWNIFNTDEPSGPETFEVEPHTMSGAKCPFCYGNEAMTPPEIHTLRPPETAPNTPGWNLRVVSNKFPALKIEGALGRRGLGIYDMCNGVGAHEVIIETPNHTLQMADLPLEQLVDIIRAFKGRSLDLRGDPRLKYSLIFKNFGLSAGASLEHPHTQLIALPIVPKRVQEELSGAAKYFEFRDRCVFCDMLSQEMQEQERLVCENSEFAAYCPFVSSFPFEVWILPKEHSADFTRLGEQGIRGFAGILKQTLQRLRATLSNPAYNFIIHTTPVDLRQHEEYHWRLELIPKLTKVAGFEWGTGFYINPTPPERAAKCLREAAV